MAKIFIGYKSDDYYMACAAVGEKTKDRIVKAVCKILLKPIEEIKVSPMSDDKIDYRINVKSDSDDFFETWVAASEFYRNENNKGIENENKE